MDFNALRGRWRDSLTGDPADTGDPDVQNARRRILSEAMDYWKSMNRDPGRTSVWRDLPDPGNPYVRDRVCLASYRRLEVMARACFTAQSLPEDFLKDLRDALRFLNRCWYNDWDRKGGEWWHKEIGIPLCLNQCVALLYEYLEDSERNDYIRAVESYVCHPEMMCIEDIPEQSTGANRVWKCLALAQCGILKQDEYLLWTASGKIRDVFCYTQGKDGFYRDGSFIQHLKFAYTGGYGVSFLDSIVSYTKLVQGTPWRVQNEELDILMDWVMNAYVPLIFRGGFMSMARGREIARKESQEHEIGHQVISALMKLLRLIPENQSVSMRKRLKGWIMDDTYRDYVSHAPLEILQDVKQLMADPDVPADRPADMCKIFAAMDRAVHHRNHYAAAISMCSERTGRYESIHNENIRGWYTSEGMLYLYNSDLGQFSDDYFPTVNSYRMPGTTVNTAPRKEQGVPFGQEPVPRTSWAGGSCLNGRYGAVGMGLAAECSDLKAKKSWFLFDEEIVCLGAGITSSEEAQVETIVENREIHCPMEEILQQGKICNDSNPAKWIHLRGPVPGSDIGYYIPGEQEPEMSEEIRSGSWQEINRTSGSDERVSNRFANIVLNHGVKPENEQYAYVLLPGKSAAETKDYAASPAILIIANTDHVQAVRNTKLNITGMNFWQDSVCSADGITCGRKASILLQETKDTLQISVSDPTWKNEDGIQIEIDRSVSRAICSDPEIQVIQMQPVFRLKVQTADAMGKSFSITLEK